MDIVDSPRRVKEQGVLGLLDAEALACRCGISTMITGLTGKNWSACECWGHTNREDSNRGCHSLVVVEYRPPVGIYFRQSLSFWILGVQRIEALSSPV
jgi:hypothetical protein